MALALHFARSLGLAPILPESLQRVERRAELVHRCAARGRYYPNNEHFSLEVNAGKIADVIEKFIGASRDVEILKVLVNHTHHVP